MRDEATFRVKSGLPEMLKGGVIMDVVTAAQATVAEEAGAAAVMALERVPADIRRDGGVARMSDPEMVAGIQAAVSIPVMAKARIGHFMEARVLEALEVDYIDESEVLTPADESNHIDKWAFKVPFVCGATNLGEALRRIGEGAAMIRSKGEAGTGDIVEAVRHLRSITGEIRRLGTLDEAELFVAAKNLQSPYDVVREVAREGKLPVPLFCAGGIATPADASLVMQLGAEAVFVGSGIFKSDDPSPRARAIVEATTRYADADRAAKASAGLADAMHSLDASCIRSRPTSTCPRSARSTPSSSARRGSQSTARRSRSSPRSTATPSQRARGRCSWCPSTPSSPATSGCTRPSSGRCVPSPAPRSAGDGGEEQPRGDEDERQDDEARKVAASERERALRRWN